MTNQTRWTALLLLGAFVAIGAGDLDRGAKKLYDSALRMARSSSFKDNQKRLLTKAMDGLETEDLEAVADRLRVVEKPLKSLPAVLAAIETEFLTRSYGREAAEKLEGLADMLRDETAEGMEGVLFESTTLEDLRLARHLAQKSAGAEFPTVRIRAAIVLSSLLNFGEAGEAESAALTALLLDEEPAVRAVACRYAFGARLDSVFTWALDHLDDGGKGKAVLLGEEEKLVPGAEALLGLQTLTRIQEELEHREVLSFSDEQKASLRELFEAWWENHDKTFPAPGFRESRFRKKPSESRTFVIDSGKTIATFQFWSGLDRTKIRAAVDEVEPGAVAIYDFEVNFHIRYMAQGMRSDDGEGYRRHMPVGSSYILARKAIGCYVLTFQMLYGGRVKVRLQFHDPVR